MKISIKEIVIESDDNIDGVVIKFINKNRDAGNGSSTTKVTSVSTVPVTIPPQPTVTPYDVTTNMPTTTASVPSSPAGSFGDVY